MVDNELLQAIEALLERKLDEKLESLETEVSLQFKSLETEVRHTRVLVESDLTKKIQIIAEQHGDIIKKLDALADYPETRGRVSTLEHVAKAHTQDFYAC